LADWTTILTALGAASIAGWFGYRGARWQGKVALETMRGELERLERQHREDHRRHRQGVYHDFLDAAEALDAVMRGAVPSILDGSFFEDDSWRPVRDELGEALRRIRHGLNGLSIFGSSAVADAALQFDAVFLQGAESELRVALLRGSVDLEQPSERVSVRELLRTWTDERSRDGWGELLGDLMRAMRADVGPLESDEVRAKPR
jgi:hypothetical protein